MILETDKALLALLRTEILGDAPVAIAFDAPNRPWTQQVKGLVLNLYLYDIRENMQRREVMYTEIRDDKGKLVERRPPPRRYDLYYAVTVWAPKVAIEHQVMACVLAGLSEYETIPAAHLPETLAASGHVVLISVADGMKRGMFQNMGGELKTSLELVVTVPIFGKLPLPTAPAVSKPVALKVNGAGAGTEQREGRPAPAGAPAANGAAANGAPATAAQPAGAGPTAVREAQQRDMVAAAKAAQAGGGAAPAGGGAAPTGAVGPGAARPAGAAGPAKAAPGAPAGQQAGRPPNPLALAQAALAQAAQSQALLAQAQAALVKVLQAATAPRQAAPAGAAPAGQPAAAASAAQKPAAGPGAQNPAGAPNAAAPGAPGSVGAPKPAQKPAAKPAQGGGGGGGGQPEPEPEADSAPE